MCLLVYFILKIFKKQKKTEILPTEEALEMAPPASPGAIMAKAQNLKTNINPFYFAAPAAFDVIGSTLLNIALL